MTFSHCYFSYMPPLSTGMSKSDLPRSGTSTGYEPLLTRVASSNGEHSRVEIHSSPEGSDVSDVTFLESEGKTFIRRQSGSGEVRSSSRVTAATQNYARTAPRSAPVIIQTPVGPVASHTANGGVRKSSPSSGALDPSQSREKRRKSVEFSTQHLHSPEKAGKSHK